MTDHDVGVKLFALFFTCLRIKPTEDVFDLQMHTKQTYHKKLTHEVVRKFKFSHLVLGSVVNELCEIYTAWAD